MMNLESRKAQYNLLERSENAERNESRDVSKAIGPRNRYAELLELETALRMLFGPAVLLHRSTQALLNRSNEVWEFVANMAKMIGPTTVHSLKYLVIADSRR
jgi:hypothetical protein